MNIPATRVLNRLVPILALFSLAMLMLLGGAVCFRSAAGFGV